MTDFLSLYITGMKPIESAIVVILDYINNNELVQVGLNPHF